jgi:hypothetical protein
MRGLGAYAQVGHFCASQCIVLKDVDKHYLYLPNTSPDHYIGNAILPENIAK